MNAPTHEAARAAARLGRLGRLVSLVLEAEALDALAQRLSRDGVIGSYASAGSSRVASIAAAEALEPSDMLFGTARDLPAALARGVTLDTIFHQLMGSADSPTLGRGLPGALHEAAHGIALSDGSAAAHMVHAAGFGHAARLRHERRVALALFGSGAQPNGELHAGLNFATRYRAQTVFVARGPLAGEIAFDQAAEAWGIRSILVRGDDGLAIYEAVREARERAVRGEGPTVLDARLDGVAEPKDAQALQAAGGWPAERAEAVRGDIERRLRAARQAAEAAESPALATLFDAVFAVRPWPLYPTGSQEAR